MSRRNECKACNQKKEGQYYELIQENEIEKRIINKIIWLCDHDANYISKQTLTIQPMIK